MKLIPKVIAAAVAALAIGNAAHAATYGWTEGIRETVVGTIDIETLTDVDGPNTPPGFDLTQGATLKSGQTIDLHGRIGSVQDNYVINSDSKFRIALLFGGYEYELKKGGTKFRALSGFTTQPVSDTDESMTDMFLDDGLGNPGASVNNTFTSDITSGDAKIFGTQAAGSYIFTINSEGFAPNSFGLYDIRITAVPLPAGGLLLLSGLAGLGLARRRKS